MILTLCAGLGGHRRGKEAHFEPFTRDPDLVNRQRVEGRGREDIAGADVELGAVARADDYRAVELAVGERALLVRAGVVEGDPTAVDPAEANRPAARLDPAERTFGGVLRRACRMPGGGVAHGCGSNPNVSSRGATPWCSAACAAALSTLARRVTTTIKNQTSATTISPIVHAAATQL